MTGGELVASVEGMRRFVGRCGGRGEELERGRNWAAQARRRRAAGAWGSGRRRLGKRKGNGDAIGEGRSKAARCWCLEERSSGVRPELGEGGVGAWGDEGRRRGGSASGASGGDLRRNAAVRSRRGAAHGGELAGEEAARQPGGAAATRRCGGARRLKRAALEVVRQGG
jgi:hypothetical protein